MGNFTIVCESTFLDYRRTRMRSHRSKGKIVVEFRLHAENALLPKEPEINIIHFTLQNKNYMRFKTRDNIKRISVKYWCDGKVTIWFWQPRVGLIIECRPVQLYQFLHELVLGLRISDNVRQKLGASLYKKMPKMFSEPDLETYHNILLTPHSIMHKIICNISSLQNLTMLDLKNNNISKVPQEFGSLSLVSLSISNNWIGRSTDWRWLKGGQLRKSLLNLDLSSNCFTNFPLAILKLKKLMGLSLDHNFIDRIPFGMRRLQNLRTFSIVYNEIESLPSDIGHMNLNILNLKGNPFKTQNKVQLDAKKTWPLPPLWLSAAREVARAGLNVTSANIPLTLVELLEELPKCACKKLCLPDGVYERASKMTFKNVENLLKNASIIIFADIVLCGPACKGCKDLGI